MRLKDLERQAAAEGIPVTQAINRYRHQLWKSFDYWLDGDHDPVTWDVLCKPSMIEILQELFQLKKDLYFKSKPKSDKDITPDMIEAAKAYPMTSLIEFKGKVAHCIDPAHADKHPSMYLSPRINKVNCPACGKRFDAIDVVMILDGLTWRDAVMRLCQQ